MISLGHLLESQEILAGLEVDHYNPLVEQDGFVECEIVGRRFDVFRNRAGVIIDLKNSLRLDPDSNTGLLVVPSLAGMSWSGRSYENRLMARTVVGSTPAVSNGIYELTIVCTPSATLTIRGQGVYFFHGIAPGMDAAPPDYGHDTIECVLAGTQSWNTELGIRGISKTG